MAGTRRTLGYKPTTHPTGWGGPASAGTMRGTTFAGRNHGYWIARLGGRVGKGGSTNTTVNFSAFNANKNSHIPGARIGSTGPLTINKLMADRVSGGDYEAAIQGGPIPVAANQPVTLSGLGMGASWAHGQDNSGATMHERSGLSSVPPTFGSTWSRPEGNMALWAITYDDAAPTIPLWEEESGGVSPGHGHSVVDETPTIEFDFRSTNEELPGIALGSADHLTKYQVQVWNANMTTKLRDSGRVNATIAMRNNRRVTWTVPEVDGEGLPPGQYEIRAQVINALGTPSAWRQWTITIVGAGSITVLTPYGVINNDTPAITWSYTHKQNLPMDAMRARIMNRSGTEVVREEIYFDYSPDPVNPSTGILEWDDTGWTALPKGARYSSQVQAIDTDGQPSPWSAPQEFRLNAPPFVPINREPLPGTVLTSIPELSAMARDADDPAASTPTEFEVRKVGSGTSVTQAGIYSRADNRWRLNLIIEGIVPPGDYGEWEWRTRSIDQYGAVGEWSTWLTFEYVSPPELTVVNPTDTIGVANPAFDWTVDRSQTAYRIQLFEADTGSPIRYGDSGWVNSSNTEHVYPSLLLRHMQGVRARIDVVTTGGIPGSIEWEFDVAYTPPPAVTGVIAEAIQRPYDFVNTKTGVRVSWNKVGTDPLVFSAYLIHRRNVATGEIEPLAVIRDINQTEWIDDSTPVGGPFEFEVMQEVWESLDLIPSEPTGDEVSVDKIVGVVITPVIGGGEGVNLVYWQNLNIDPVHDKTVRSSWASKPRISAGSTNYRVISGTAYILKDMFEGRFTETDLGSAVHLLSDPYVDENGITRPRTICARLFDGRVIYGSITSISEGDQGSSSGRAVNVNIRRRAIRIEITETNFNRGGS